MIYPWQTDDWTRLQQLRSHWPHALLLHGQAGIGKLHFAKHLAQGLLCESPLPNGEPCGRCAACGWFSQGNHPDYRIVVPEALAAETGAAPADDKAEKADKGDGDDAKKTRAPSKEIRIEQVRALLDFSGVGSHRGGMRVVVLYPAEALNVAAANALLKTLEEPPAGVVFLLVSARIDRLLPTIISRCRQWPMGTPSPQAAQAWLAAQGVGDAGTLLAEAGGAPLAALALAHDDSRALRDWTLAQLASGAACDAFACGETLQKLPVPLVLGWLQRWLYDLLAERTAGRPRYFPQAGAALARCAGALDPAALARYTKTITRQRAVENHPLNARLVFEELFLGYRELFA
ncbi:DNA polymerase III subunit delta' [Paraburkholderia caballeronis]|uniref:DNA polymerase III, delta prime subunit n=1 Tax=Paraburkholderia caballeronis TaxID=416943 RepID=A0A1H7JI76_9BURK|nr:DNA polymerase III subunit delta' [Paraburkholderia caballeronis]PXW27453.1 DNA polymerase III delta prime subunit [Paraburkholderia caballeronis]PXX02927.1 DNA polymerase III delta prime subunit [Paraburkholderia caballeronis]RAK03652.1 DNA polymerase III delta prime subunit [Paraburkholderia caballeronis]SEC27878.1 DNA polymerase III, delta prime subunit [Paraburkholderia caballeronis]SEK73135.1 DNA polymerase III, delta prime subunit [Paraburkholderia caballeronis]